MAGAGWWLHRRQRPLPSPPALPDPLSAEVGLSVGDVLLWDDAEVWLKGALVVRDGPACVAVVFFTDDAQRQLLVRPAPRREMLSLRPIAPSSFAPDVLELEGRLYRRVRKLPVRIERHGPEAPEVEDGGRWSESRAIDAEVVMLDAGERVLGWVGEPAEQANVLRMAAGQATLRTES